MRRSPANNNSRTAWRPSTWVPPRPRSLLAGRAASRPPGRPPVRVPELRAPMLRAPAAPRVEVGLATTGTAAPRRLAPAFVPPDLGPPDLGPPDFALPRPAPDFAPPDLGLEDFDPPDLAPLMAALLVVPFLPTRSVLTQSVPRQNTRCPRTGQAHRSPRRACL